MAPESIGKKITSDIAQRLSKITGYSMMQKLPSPPRKRADSSWHNKMVSDANASFRKASAQKPSVGTKKKTAQKQSQKRVTIKP